MQSNTQSTNAGKPTLARPSGVHTPLTRTSVASTAMRMSVASTAMRTSVASTDMRMSFGSVASVPTPKRRLGPPMRVKIPQSPVRNIKVTRSEAPVRQHKPKSPPKIKAAKPASPLNIKVTRPEAPARQHKPKSPPKIKASKPASPLRHITPSKRTVFVKVPMANMEKGTISVEVPVANLGKGTVSVKVPVANMGDVVVDVTSDTVGVDFTGFGGRSEASGGQTAPEEKPSYMYV